MRRALEAGCASISYTYTEPTIFFEYAFDTAVLAKQAGLKNVFVTNGYTAAEPLRAIAPYLDAANVDLKSFSDAFYKKICGARLQPVLDTLKLYRELGIWLEVTTLVIPGENDTDEDLGGCARFVAEELGRDVPWHVSAFRPTYLLTERPAHAAGDAAAGAADRPGGGAEVRLRGQHPRRGRGHALSGVREDGDRAVRLHGAREPAARRPLPGLQGGGPGVWA